MRRAARAALHVLAAGAALAALVVAAAIVAVVALSRGFERERVARLVAERVGAALDAEVRIGRLEGALFDGFRAEDVELRAGDGPPLAAAAIDVRFDPSPLWRERRLAIASLELDGLRAALTGGGAGGWRLAGVGRPLAGGAEDGAPPALRAVAIERLVVRDARVEVALATGDAARDTRAALALDGEAAGLAWQDGAPLRLPPSLGARVALAPSTLAGRAVERGSLELRVEGARLLVPSAELAGAFGTLALADGEVALAGAELPLRPTAASVRARVAALDLAALTGEPRLASRLDGSLELSFAPDDSARPAAGTLAARAELASAPVAGLAIDSIRLRGTLRTDTRAFALEEARVAGAAGAVELAAAGDPERAGRLALRADLRLERLPAAWRGPLAGGRLRAQLDAQGAWRDPRATLSAAVEELRLGARGPGRFALRAQAAGERRLRVDELALALPGLDVRNQGPARLRLEDGAVAIEALALAGPGVRASASGRVARGALRALRVELEVGDLAAARAALGIEAPLAGRASGWLEADGPPRAPALRGELAAAPLASGDVRVERVELALRTEDGRLRAEGRVVDRGATRLRFAGALARDALFGAPGELLARPDTELGLTADALEIGWLAGLAGHAGDQLAGLLSADLRLTGARPEPRAAGFVRLDEGRLALPGVAEPLGPIAAELRLVGDALQVERFRVTGWEGEIRGSGGLRWSPAARAPGETDLRLVFDRYSLPPGGAVSGRLVGELSLSGVWPEVRLAGRVAMDPGRFRTSPARDPAWREIRVHGLPGEEPRERPREPGEPAPALPDAFARSRANLALGFLPGSRLTGQGADLRLAGEIRLLKEAGEAPLFVGSIRTTEGFYVFRGRRFAVERGSATLAGTRELDPELDVVAAQRIGEVTLRVVVSGRASAPVVTLESDPPLDASDQLAYLAFGRPASALGTSDAARLEAAATQVVSELLLQSGVATTLFDRLPVERLEVQSGGPEGQGLVVGAELLRGVRVFYARDLGAGESGARVEWRFRRHWMVQSEVGEGGETAADLIWTYEF